MWVDNDGNIRQMKIDADIDFDKLSAITGDKTASSLKLGLSLTIKYSGFGQSVNISKPANALPFEDLIKGSRGNASEGNAGASRTAS